MVAVFMIMIVMMIVSVRMGVAVVRMAVMIVLVVHMLNARGHGHVGSRLRIELLADHQHHGGAE